MCLSAANILSEVPGQHELRFEHGAVVRHDSIQRRAHSILGGEALHRADAVPSLALEPAPVQLPGRADELDEEVAREVLRLDLSPLLPPEPKHRVLRLTEDSPCVRATGYEQVGRTKCRVNHQIG